MPGRWLLIVFSAVAAACASPPAHAAAPVHPPAAAHGLPDTVLARVAGHRDIARAWAAGRWRDAHSPAEADSITPAGASGFLDLLVDEAVLTEAAVKAAPAWASEDSAGYRALGDRLVLAAALDSVLGDARRSLPPDSSADVQALGAIARDRVIATLAVEYDDAACARLAAAFAALPKPSADSSLQAQLRALQKTPELAPADTGAVVARSLAGDVTAQALVRAWTALGPAYRPRIDTATQVHDLVANTLFQRRLRAWAAGGAFDRAPNVERALTQRRERLARDTWLAAQLADIACDSAAVAAYWNTHARDWALSERATGIRLTVDDPASAMHVRKLMADPVAAESLAVRAERGGTSYRFVADAKHDSATFRRARAAGAGGVIEPAQVDGAWIVGRVTALLPPRERSLAEVRDDVENRCAGEAAERRVRALADRLRAEYGVQVAPGAGSQLAAAIRTKPAAAPAAKPSSRAR